MPNSDFRGALDAFLASSDFEDVVQDDLAELPFIQRVVELHRDGHFTVFSQRGDAITSADTLVLGIPLGTKDAVRSALEHEFTASE
ncbi:MAG TPA: hypothetical protein VNL35_09175 [Chloroflexota bacterium]|nr:hypothetical protein [Chloroflexota bacterium]